jgi:hypothetical protein
VADSETEELHVGDTNTRIISTIVDEGGDAVNLATATTLQYKLRKPSGTVVTLTCELTTDGTDGMMEFTTTDSTLNESGFYRLQAYIGMSSGAWHSDKVSFRVWPNLG